MFNILFYLAVFVLFFGLICQVIRFRKQQQLFAAHGRHSSGVDGFKCLFNTIFQARLFTAGKVRWLLHFLLVVSFIYLVVVHGLYTLTADLFFDDYQPTLDPFQALRNLTGFFCSGGLYQLFDQASDTASDKQ
jgi:hypothetical protein